LKVRATSAWGRCSRMTAVMIRRALDTLSSVADSFLCRERCVSYVLKQNIVSPTQYAEWPSEGRPFCA
jgi:hypothetical protein